MPRSMRASTHSNQKASVGLPECAPERFRSRAFGHLCSLRAAKAVTCPYLAEGLAWRMPPKEGSG